MEWLKKKSVIILLAILLLLTLTMSYNQINQRSIIEEKLKTELPDTAEIITYRKGPLEMFAHVRLSEQDYFALRSAVTKYTAPGATVVDGGTLDGIDGITEMEYRIYIAPSTGVTKRVDIVFFKTQNGEFNVIVRS